MNVQLLDLKAQYASIKEEIRAAVEEVLESQHFIMGPKVSGFEKDCCEYLGTGNTLGVSSGSDALLLALMALDIKPGDKVITTPFSFFATAGCVARLGAIPVFADIDPETFTISPDSVETILRGMAESDRKKVKAIIPVHLYGQMADMNRIMDIAGRYGLYVVEDAAQAFGSDSLYNNEVKKAGTIGHIGCYSFFPSKNLGAYGDGGMVSTNDPHLHEKMKILRVHGSSPKYYHKVIGGNFRLDELQAAVLQVKLRYLDQWSRDRQSVAGRYCDGLARVEGIQAPVRKVQTEYGHIYHQYVVRCSSRDSLQAKLTAAGIGNAVYYPVPLHLQECFAYLGYSKGDMPESERAAEEVLALPIYPELDTVEIDTVLKLLIL